MNNSVDIILPWLNANDAHWQNDYISYLKTQGKGDKSIIRTREWNLFKYFLRSVSKNCNWINKLYICVYDEKQIPEWINLNNEKLKFIFHKDILPKECLPTYNSLCVSSYLPIYKELSENIILCSDDFYFVNETKMEDFFRNGKCVKYKEPLNKKSTGLWGYFRHTPSTWENLMKNTVLYKERISGNSTYYPMYHIPEAFHKSDFLNFYEKHGNDILIEYSKNKNKIRQSTNIHVPSVVKYLQLDNNDFISDKNFIKDHLCIDITDKPNWKMIMNTILSKKTVCINDQVYTTNINKFNEIKNKLTLILNSVFPDKCEFEV